MIILLGLLIGFLAAIPIGPLNIFAISQAMKHGFLSSFLVGLTAAFLDVVYCFAAIEGISLVTSTVAKFNPVLKLMGALLLILISILLIKQSRTLEAQKSLQKLSNNNYSRPVVVSFFLYASNPTLYAFWLAVAGIVTAHQWVANKGFLPLAFALSCGAGSTFWYLMLTKYVSKYHKNFTQKAFKKILVGLAVILFGFALYNLATLL